MVISIPIIQKMKFMMATGQQAVEVAKCMFTKYFTLNGSW